MKKMNQKEKIVLFIMIVFMILTDILICFDNTTIQMIGYLCLFIVLGLLVYFCIDRGRENKKQQELDAKKIIEQMASKKKVSK